MTLHYDELGCGLAGAEIRATVPSSLSSLLLMEVRTLCVDYAYIRTGKHGPGILRYKGTGSQRPWKALGPLKFNKHLTGKSI